MLSQPPDLCCAGDAACRQAADHQASNLLACHRCHTPCCAGFVGVRAVPGLSAARDGHGGGMEATAWLLPLWILVVAFCGAVLHEARSTLRHYTGDRPVVVLCRSGNVMLSSTIAVVMLTGAVVLTVFCGLAAPGITPVARYELYDGGGGSGRAAPFLPTRAPYSQAAFDAALAEHVAAAAAQTGTGTSSGTDTSNNTSASSSALAAIVLEDGAPPVAPGDAGRWLLPDAAAPAWTAWGALLWSVHSASGLWSAYTLLQGIVLLLMIIK